MRVHESGVEESARIGGTKCDSREVRFRVTDNRECTWPMD
jgi:hypothetical protein